MKVINLTNLRKKDSPLLYRREFSADAIFELMEQQTSKPVEFVLEHKATGGIDIKVTITEDIDYPVLPVVSNLKQFILEMHRRGALS